MKFIDRLIAGCVPRRDLYFITFYFTFFERGRGGILPSYRFCRFTTQEMTNLMRPIHFKHIQNTTIQPTNIKLKTQSDSKTQILRSTDLAPKVKVKVEVKVISFFIYNFQNFSISFFIELTQCAQHTRTHTEIRAHISKHRRETCVVKVMTINYILELIQNLFLIQIQIQKNSGGRGGTY